MREHRLEPDQIRRQAVRCQAVISQTAGLARCSLAQLVARTLFQRPLRPGLVAVQRAGSARLLAAADWPSVPDVGLTLHGHSCRSARALRARCRSRGHGLAHTSVEARVLGASTSFCRGHQVDNAGAGGGRRATRQSPLLI